MKTKLTMDKNEMKQLLSKIVPPEFFPKGAIITDFEVRGYPIKEYEITIETPSPEEAPEEETP